jgi:HEXXH motif-containing protein
MTILDLQPLAQLKKEFGLSMRRLFRDLCRELQADYADLAATFALPVGLFELLGQAAKSDAYAGWKVVGWIEALNDLVYFLDILQQWKAEPDQTEFAEQLFAECQEKFFENSYLDELFPQGRPRVAGLERRLVRLCRRLSQDLTQEALLIEPALSVKWCRQRKVRRWEVRASISESYERGEEAGSVPIGLAGDRCIPPPDVAAAVKPSTRISFRVEPTGISVKVGRLVSPLWTGWGTDGQWHWTRRSETVAVATQYGPVTVGPTLVYGKDRQPHTVTRTAPQQVARIRVAWTTIEEAWPEGHQVLALLTSRIVPLRAKGVVSFSYRHRPGLSFINCFDRDNLDLIDDLIHENSHHHLNLLLRKHVMYHGDHNQQIFYSPWRRSLRPLRGILHATFTFTMGAMLFERLSSWASGRGGAGRWKTAGLTTGDLQRARFRCLEEVESVRYALQDLHYADHHLGWLTGSGRRMVGQLTEAINHVHESIWPHEKVVMRSSLGPSLRRHIKALQEARQTYGPMQLSPV